MSGGLWHEVRQGEWMTKIASDYHIADWRGTIWEHPNNSDLAQNRDPNHLFPGDQVFIPERQPKYEDRPTDAAHEFVVKREWDEFYLKLVDASEKPIANQSYVLDVGVRKYEGTTDGNGELHIEKMDPQSQDGMLTFPNIPLQLPVQMGAMNPGHAGGSAGTASYDDGISGIQMRLINLGYDPGEADGTLNPSTESAIKEFQIFDMGLEPDQVTGKLDDNTRKAIMEQHGS